MSSELAGPIRAGLARARSSGMMNLSRTSSNDNFTLNWTTCMRRNSSFVVGGARRMARRKESGPSRRGAIFARRRLASAGERRRPSIFKVLSLSLAATQLHERFAPLCTRARRSFSRATLLAPSRYRSWRHDRFSPNNARRATC